jgi:hypothetical protein
MQAETDDPKLWVPEHIRTTQLDAEPQLYVPGYGLVRVPKASSAAVRISAIPTVTMSLLTPVHVGGTLDMSGSLGIEHRPGGLASAGVRFGLVIATPRRRGPQRRTPEAWLRWTAGDLAELCRVDQHHPLEDCDWICVGKAVSRSPGYLADEGSRKGVLLHFVRTYAWDLLGRPMPTFGKF